MKLTLGDKIKELRIRDGRKQEDLAKALGVSNQAVSRWEKDGCYPDMEIIPAIANYFGVSIDELFGYQNDRDKKVISIIDRVKEYDIHNKDDLKSAEECIMVLRNGLAEFPNNESLLITLAETLWEVGWLNHDNWLGYDKNGYIQYHYDAEKKNLYWKECLKICDNLVENTSDNNVFTRAIVIIVPLLRNFGEFDKAISFALRMPKLTQSQEYLLTEATDGKISGEYNGRFLLEAARHLSEQLVFCITSNIKNFDSDMPIEKVKGAIALFNMICSDGNMGEHHDFLSKLYMYLSALQWKYGKPDDAFDSLTKSFEHAELYDQLFYKDKHEYTAPFVKSIEYEMGVHRDVVKSLLDEFPYYRIPDSAKIKSEMMTDLRWNELVERLYK